MNYTGQMLVLWRLRDVFMRKIGAEAMFLGRIQGLSISHDESTQCSETRDVRASICMCVCGVQVYNTGQRATVVTLSC